MNYDLTILSDSDRAVVRATKAFLFGRLEERETVVWALNLSANDFLKKVSVLELTDNPVVSKIEEPWRSAWSTIEESWSAPPEPDMHSSDLYGVKSRMKQGDMSGAVINKLVDLVAPYLKVKSRSNYIGEYETRKLKPKSASDLMSITISSGSLLDLEVIKIEEVKDLNFLVDLACQLDASLTESVNLSKRLGWDENYIGWQLGAPDRVYYVGASKLDGGGDPDRYTVGISPCVKFLHLVVDRINDLEGSIASTFASRWKVSESPIYLRLWAALSRSPSISDPKEVGEVLMKISRDYFWDVHNFPEITELRAVRFKEFSEDIKLSICKRISLLPPSPSNKHGRDSSEIKEFRIRSALLEFNRLVTLGGELPKKYLGWVEKKSKQFDDLIQVENVHHGFSRSYEARIYSPERDKRYDSLSGSVRLKAIENAIRKKTNHLGDDESGRAEAWLRDGENSRSVIQDIRMSDIDISRIPHILNALMWSHKPELYSDNNKKCKSDLAYVFKIILEADYKTLRSAISGISYWFFSWKKELKTHKNLFSVWSKLWPISVDSTNETDLKEVFYDSSYSSDESSQPKIDTLNTPVSRLIHVFFQMLPVVKDGDRPFKKSRNLSKIRKLIISSEGRAGLISKHNMIEILPYFLMSDPDWTESNLIAPLMKNTTEAITLWHAVGLKTRFRDVLTIIGSEMSERASDSKVGREIQNTLVFSLLVDALHSFRDGKAHVVPTPKITQMLRSISDEVRSSAVRVFHTYIREVSAQNGGDSYSKEELYRVAISPFIKEVWPQEKSIITSGVGREFARLPACCGNKFSLAVDEVKRFVVPFNCWSISDFGILRAEGLEIIDSKKNALSLLELLDSAIGEKESSVVPHDLPDALDKIRDVDSSLINNPIYRKLGALSRR